MIYTVAESKSTPALGARCTDVQHRARSRSRVRRALADLPAKLRCSLDHLYALRLARMLAAALLRLLLCLPAAQAQWGPANDYGGKYKPGMVQHLSCARVSPTQRRLYAHRAATDRLIPTVYTA